MTTNRVPPIKPGAICPDARISSPTRHRDGKEIVDVNTYIPYFLSSINNALSRSASLQYRQEFGIGIVDWRVISMLAIEPKIPASRIGEVLSLDKAQTSRSLQLLSDRLYVEFKTSENDTRRKTWWLSDAGYNLHDRILLVARTRERQLIAGADPEDLEAFLRIVRLMRHNVEGF